MKAPGVRFALLGTALCLAGLSTAWGSDAAAPALHQLENAAGQPASYGGARASFGETLNQNPSPVPATESAEAATALTLKKPEEIKTTEPEPGSTCAMSEYRRHEHPYVKKGRAIGATIGSVGGAIGGGIYGWMLAAKVSSYLAAVGAAAGAGAGVVVGMTVFGGIGMMLGLYLAGWRNQF